MDAGEQKFVSPLFSEELRLRALVRLHSPLSASSRFPLITLAIYNQLHRSAPAHLNSLNLACTIRRMEINVSISNIAVTNSVEGGGVCCCLSVETRQTNEQEAV